MRRIAIIGGGFSGTLLSVHLMRHAAAQQAAGLHITLIEREPTRLARGFAYATPHDACLLNVPAGRMSAFEDSAHHFIDWAKAQDPSIGGGAFVRRGFYGEYLNALLREATDAARQRNATFDQVIGHAVAIDDPGEPGGGSVVLTDGRRLEADRIVLALGNFPPCDPDCAEPGVLRSDRYTRNPWAPGALKDIPRDGNVLLIGTGLTMFDVALVLRDVHRIHAVSRRGLMPQPHRESATPPPALPFPDSMRHSHATPLKLLRALRQEIRIAGARGENWREVVTALRHDTPQLWQWLDDRGRRQFLRHLLPFWDTHRHRAAPQTAAAVQALREQGRLIVRAARLVRIEEPARPGPLRVTLRPRGSPGTQALEADHIINCTGPDPDLRRCADPLIVDGLLRGLLATDVLGLGLRTAPDGALLRADGSISRRLFTLGALRRGELWETTAVPELRVQAQQLAGRLFT